MTYKLTLASVVLFVIAGLLAVQTITLKNKIELPALNAEAKAAAVYNNFKYLIRTSDFVFLFRESEITTLAIVPRKGRSLEQIDPTEFIEVRLVNQDGMTINRIFEGWESFTDETGYTVAVPPPTCPFLSIDININKGKPYTIIHERNVDGSDPWQFGATKGVLCYSAVPENDPQNLVKFW